jgi:hypothetical protein
MNKTHSFSTKTQTDLDLVQKMKFDAAMAGRSFSWVILKALELYQSTKETTNIPPASKE